MPTADRLRTDDVAGGGTPQPLVAGQSRARGYRGANYGTNDVRFNPLATTVITLVAYDAADAFDLGVYAHTAGGDFERTDTAAFVSGTNCASSDLQTALRTATGDASLTVSGTTDTGPFTVTHFEAVPEIVAHTITGGASIQITRGASTGGDPESSTVGNGINFDQESSDHAYLGVPLGYGTITDGTGQDAGTPLLPPTVDGAAGGTGEVVITATEAASGGTSAVVLYAIHGLDSDFATYAKVDAEDADGDVTYSSLAAGDYVLLAHTQTANGQVSRPAAPVYFSVA
jgi:hypothetical protein